MPSLPRGMWRTAAQASQDEGGPGQLDPAVPESHHAQTSCGNHFSFTVCWDRSPRWTPRASGGPGGVATGAAQLCLQNQSRGCHYVGQSGEGSKARRLSPKADALSGFSLSWLFLCPLSPLPLPPPPRPSSHPLPHDSTNPRPASSAIPSHTGPGVKVLRHLPCPETFSGSPLPQNKPRCLSPSDPACYPAPPLIPPHSSYNLHPPRSRLHFC